MNKSIFLSFTAAILLTSTSFAYDEQMEDGFRDATLRNGQIASAQKLNKAIQIRQQNYLREKLRDSVQKNAKNQIIRHTLSRAEASTDGVSTYMKRSGELADYSGRRPFTYSRVTVPNNAKRNFRTRAYDYYIDGGNAGTDVLESDVVLSDEMNPVRRSYRANNMSTADIINSIRMQQKNSAAPVADQSVQKRTTSRIGDSSRNFIHPYMKIDLGN
jgi:hypothetical protein